MQAQGNCCHLVWLWCCAKVFASQFIETEFGLSASLPQEFQRNGAGFVAGLRQQIGRRWADESDQYVTCLDLAALTVRRLDLK